MKNVSILVLIAVVTSVANVSLGELVVDLRATSATGTTQIIDPKTVIPGHASDVLTFQLFAIVQGYTNPTKNQAISLLQGNIKEIITNASSTTRGDMATIPATGATTTDIYGPVYDGGFRPFLTTNSFGDQEFGDTLNTWNPRSNTPHDAKEWQYIGTFSYTLKSVNLGASSVTSIQFVPKTALTGAAWFLDNVAMDGRDGFISNRGVSLVPEPCSLGLLGIGTLAFLAWTWRARRKAV